MKNNLRKKFILGSVVTEVSFLDEENFRSSRILTRLTNNILYDENKEINCWH